MPKEMNDRSRVVSIDDGRATGRDHFRVVIIRVSQIPDGWQSNLLQFQTTQ